MDAAVPLLGFAAVLLAAGAAVCLASVAVGLGVRRLAGAGRAVKAVLVGGRVLQLAVVLVGFLAVVALGMDWLAGAGIPALDDTTRLVGLSFGLLLATVAANAAFRRGLGR